MDNQAGSGTTSTVISGPNKIYRSTCLGNNKEQGSSQEAR